MGHESSKGTAFVITHEPDPNRQRKAISWIALAVTRSIGRHGVPVVRLHPNRLDHSLSSKYCSEVVLCPDMYASESALVEHLLELAERYAGPRVLIPASDDCAQFLGKYRDTLEPSYAVCVSSPEVIELVMNKQRPYEAAEKVGVPIPETYFPKSDDEFAEILAQADNYPYVIKPLVAHTWRLASMKKISQGKKALRVSTPEELEQAYQSMGETRSQVMIQEVIGGRDEQLLTLLGYFRRDGSPLAYCVRKKTRQYPVDFGFCTHTVSCENPAVVDLSLRLLASINYSGICGVEYKYDANTDSYKLIEINARPVNTIGLAPACGVNLPHIAFRDLAGEDVTPVTRWENDVRWSRLVVDFYAARELRRRQGAPSFGQWIRSVTGKGTDGAFARDDLGMSLGYYGSVFMNKVWSKLGT